MSWKIVPQLRMKDRWCVLTYFGMKSIRVSFKTSSDCPESVDLMLEVISTAAAVARIAKLTIRKTVAVTAQTSTSTHIIKSCTVLHFLHKTSHG